MAGKCDDSDLLAFLRQTHTNELAVANGVVSNGTTTPVMADKSRRSRDGPLIGTCVVCEDPRGSIHFGVLSCAACSAFFRRTISENRKYLCRRHPEGNPSCPIDQKHRCYCRACRMQKCLLMGMDPAAVQLHRDTYGSKQARRSQENDSAVLHSPNNFSDELTWTANTPGSFSRISQVGQLLINPPHAVDMNDGFCSFLSATKRSEIESKASTAAPSYSAPVTPTSQVMRPIAMNCEVSEDVLSRNMIEMMVKSYQQMLERRRLVYCPSSIRDILGGTMPETKPACYFGERVRRDRLRVDIALLVEFLNSIPPFPNLDIDDKIALMKNFSVAFAILEKYYITMLAGGLQTNRIFHSDGTYSDLGDPDSIAREANKVAGENVDRETLNKLFVESLKDFLLQLSGPMYHNGMTDIEFCALNAVLLFDPSAAGLSESGSVVVREVRDRIYKDWFDLYDKMGVRDIGQRVGNTMLLLPAVQGIVGITEENFRLIQVFDLFHYDKILDEFIVGDVTGIHRHGLKKLRMTDAVRQGFICPFCMVDLGDFPRLQSHVDSVHPERGQDLTETVIDNVKGVTRSHTEFFKKIRDSSVNESAVRTNMLIIRLDRLINECPCDPSKRKEFERDVVPWTADSEALHCTRCAAKFGLARRRHHCRLCGRVMCHQCSQFLSFLSARKLTNPALAAEMLNNDSTAATEEVSPSHSRRLLEMTQKTTGKVISFIEGAVSKMQTTAADGTEVSLGSLLQQDAQECLRVCGPCMTDLSRREQMMEQRNPPILAEQYETLDRMIAEVSAMVPSYTRMSDSINNGETMYTLAAAEQLRNRLLQKQRDIDTLSQKIVAEIENESCGIKEAQLRKNIRYACVQTLQSMVSSMVSLPSAEQYEKLVEIHKKEVARQIEETRMRAASELPGVRACSSLPSVMPRERPAANPVKELPRKRADDGWTPQQTKYLAQAATAGRLEEVEMLERNLRDLEDEMLKMGLISPT
ncbi:unnamed protein product [Nippostrongylus brasiliensis]|uniref:Rabenosyn-5 (inferred by orthology to a human protein) n=1 Tax=Nippostrongylus brasiliensis TaxID=27835 RepID=A0A158QY90_NIPBR|nr:unnamed protein product [Nippostrongylus brasiliensis]